MKPFTTLTAILFIFVALAHLLRLYYGWEIIFSGKVIPVWVSGIGFVVAGGLATMLLKEAQK